MSILINMEMPKRCIDCTFMISRDNDDCILQSDEANATFETWDNMKANCPLVEIPPHGRLIDADALVNDCEKYIKSLNPDVDGKEISKVRWLIGVLNEQPTIVPEERSDHGK